MVWNIYFHGPACLDGAGSVVGALSVLQQTEGVNPDDVTLIPVDYDHGSGWTHEDLGAKSVVVDFPYNPTADLWIDHHANPFVSPDLKTDFLRRRDAQPDHPLLGFDPEAPACLKLIDDRQQRLGVGARIDPELVRAVAMTDSADYESAEQALFGADAALVINAGLAYGSDAVYINQLIRALLTDPIAQVARWSEVTSKARMYRADRDHYLNGMRDRIVIEEGGLIGTEFLEGVDTQFTRFGAFYLYPDLVYLMQVRNGVVRIGVNPWYLGPYVHLGNIAHRFHERAGGHKFIGTIRIPQGVPLDIRQVADYFKAIVIAEHRDLRDGNAFSERLTLESTQANIASSK